MNKIRAIASRVRRKCEAFAMSSAASNYDFHNNDDLSCMCAVASFVLAEALKKQGIKCNVIHGNFWEGGWDRGEHCWVEVGRNIVDITATQFLPDGPKVYIVSKKNRQYRRGEVKNHYSQFKNWYSQRPSPWVSQKILKCS